MENDLIRQIENIAKNDHDGHFAIFGFTTNYKGCYGTPNISWFDGEDDLDILKPFKTLQGVMESMVKNPQKHVLNEEDDEDEDDETGLRGLYNTLAENYQGGNVYLSDGMYLDRHGNITSEQYG